MYCYLPLFLGLFESFRSDLTGSKGGRLRREFSLTSLTFNSHRWKDFQVSTRPQTFRKIDDYMGLCNNCIIPQKRLGPNSQSRFTHDWNISKRYPS